MSAEATLAQQYRQQIREMRRYFFERNERGMLTGESVAVAIDRLAPRNPAQGMTFKQARALVNELLEHDPRAVDLLAGLLARGLSAEAAYINRAKSQDVGISSTRISFEERREIIDADAELKRAGETSKGKRNDLLAKQFKRPPDTIRKITPKEAHGRPRKARDKP
ncbi:conserved hypothetical protein [Paraburkholderia sacchari]|uniref:hypothetical protein n=1 Tax=Paraburkholderia sacchari TaxID=159450 RepID=UPI0039A40378